MLDGSKRKKVPEISKIVLFLSKVTVVSLILVFSFIGQNYAMNFTLTWDSNSEPDLAGYYIYYKKDCLDSPYLDKIRIDDPNTCTWPINELSEGIYYFTITAFDTSNLESAHSNIATNAPEICDGKDNDFDGEIDEGVLNIYYQDEDTDGFGNSNNTVEACDPPDGYTENGEDCDDLDSSTNPAAEEVYDGKDNNCNDTVDEGVMNSADISMKAEDWPIYSGEGNITNEYDAELKREVLKTVDEENTGFGIFNSGTDSDLGLQISGKHYLSILLNTTEEFTVYVGVKGDNDKPYWLTYIPGEESSTYYYSIGNINDGSWQVLVRDLDQDLFTNTGTHLDNVTGVYIQGQIKIAEIKLWERFPDDISFEKPKDGAEIGALYVNVSGESTSEMDTITINGNCAEVRDKAFSLDNLPLDPGKNFITAVGYLINGHWKGVSAFSSISVNVNLNSSLKVLIPQTDWFIFTGEGSISNEYDPELKRDVVRTIANQDAQITIANIGGSDINGEGLNISDKPYLSILLNTIEQFSVYIGVKGDNDKTYWLMYIPNVDYSAYYYSVGHINNGSWQVLSRNLDQDLYVKTRTHLASVMGIIIFGQIKIAEITLSPQSGP